MPFRASDNAVPAAELWLDWLRTEVQGWIDRPEWVRSVQLILTNQNKPIGYVEECRLNLGIIDRFTFVPWSDGLRNVVAKSLTMHLEGLPEAE